MASYVHAWSSKDLPIDTVLSVTKDTTSDGHCMKYSENCSLH